MIEGILAFSGLVFLVVITWLVITITIKKTRNKITNVADKLFFSGLFISINYIFVEKYGNSYLEYVIYFVLALAIIASFLLYIKKQTLKG